MAKVLVPLAQGCEELEAVTIIDLLRRANIEVITAGLDDESVVASRQTVLKPDTTLDAVMDQDFDMIALPGGLPGADHLKEDRRIGKLLRDMSVNGKFVAAICAAPKALASAGLLEGRTATYFPGSLSDEELKGVSTSSEPVVQDASVITSRGPGTAMDFALHLIEVLTDKATRDRVEGALQRP